MKRLGLAALFAIGVGLFTSSPARAQEGEDWGTIDLGATSAEPGASGQATPTNVSFPDSSEAGQYWVEPYSGDLSMTCQGLRPHTTYNTSVGRKMKTGRDGTLQGVMRKHFEVWWWFDDVTGRWIRRDPFFYVSVERAQGSRDLVLIGAYYVDDSNGPPPAR